MKSRLVTLLLFLLLLNLPVQAEKVLIYMDLKQSDHLKAYGVAYWTLEQGINVEWLLNYRGGSFLIDYFPALERELRIRGIAYEGISEVAATQIYAQIEENNMDRVLLEKAPAIAIYQSPRETKWDDAVHLALIHSEIPFTVIWDEEVLKGELDKYDWLHLHHEDFTGQYGKFYANSRNAPWYIEMVRLNEEMAHKLGFKKVSEEKKAVAQVIKNYVGRGGFLFAMCSATDTYDLALAAENVDICPAVFDGSARPQLSGKTGFFQNICLRKFQALSRPDGLRIYRHRHSAWFFAHLAQRRIGLFYIVRIFREVRSGSHNADPGSRFGDSRIYGPDHRICQR